MTEEELEGLICYNHDLSRCVLTASDFQRKAANSQNTALHEVLEKVRRLSAKV